MVKFDEQTIFPSQVIQQNVFLLLCLKQQPLNKKNLIYMYQSDFRTNYSTDLCLAQLTDFVATDKDKQKHTAMILADIQKTFGSLEHGVFLDKKKKKKRNILVSRHLSLNCLSPIFQTENFWFVLTVSFLRLEH